MKSQVEKTHEGLTEQFRELHLSEESVCVDDWKHEILQIAARGRVCTYIFLVTT